MTTTTPLSLSRLLMTVTCMILGWQVWATEYNVAVIVPMEHKAMDEIVEGLKDTLPSQTYKVTVYRAHGDLNILANIYNQITYQKVDIVVPIGTTTSQMAVASLPQDRTIICAATSIIPPRPNVYTIDDTADLSPLLLSLPNLKYIGICYSAEDKNIQEVTEVKTLLKASGIKVEERMVHAIQDLPIAVQTFSPSVQAIVILKDHMIVSALPIFLEECHQRKIPLISSDQGSVSQGATIALGIAERSIGEVAGEVILKHMSHEEQAQTVSLSSHAKLYYNPTTLPLQSLWTIEQLKGLEWNLVEEQ